MSGCTIYDVLVGFFFVSLSTTTVSASEYSFLILNDLHYDPTYFTRHESCQEKAVDQRGPYGHYDCDAPWSLIESTVEAARSKWGSPDFIIWAGDAPHHALNQSDTVLDADMLIEIVTNITNLIKSKFQDTPVLPMIGNHDYRPSNQIPEGENQIFTNFLSLWQEAGWFTDDHTEAITTFKRGAYYSMEVAGGYKAIVLNDNFYLPSNRETTGVADPGGQFEWLEQTLQTAQQAGQKVHLFLHVPIGYKETDPNEIALRLEQNDKLVEIIRQYSGIIASTHSAHEHTDTFKVIYDQAGDPVSYMLMSPSVTPWRWYGGSSTGRNPAFRVVKYEDTSDHLLDVEQYFMILPKKGDTNTPEWRRLYTFKSAYGLHSITPSSLHNLTQTFREFASEAFHTWHRYNTVNATDVNPGCSCQCKHQAICSMEEVQEAGYKACMADTSFCDCLYCNNGHMIRLSFSSITFMILLSSLFSFLKLY